MPSPKAHSLGGIAQGKLAREAALLRYQQNPNICLSCGVVIEVKESEKVSLVRKKKFCDRSCASVYNNKMSPKRQKSPESLERERQRVRCPYCNGDKDQRSLTCSLCKAVLYRNITLKELRAKYNKNSYASVIRNNSRIIFQKTGKMECAICGYTHHVDVCHIKPVAAFPEDAQLSEVNALSNLVALCPNHHWELDHGLIALKGSQTSE